MTSNPYEPESLGLLDVLQSLSSDLVAARDATARRGGGFGLLVQSAVVEFDVAFTLERAGKADAGVRVWVVQAGVGGSLKQDKTTGQRITLTLIPDAESSTARRKVDRRPGPGPVGASPATTRRVASPRRVAKK